MEKNVKNMIRKLSHPLAGEILFAVRQINRNESLYLSKLVLYLVETE